MSNIDKRELRETAEKVLPAMKRLLMMPNDELFDEVILNVDDDVDAANAFNLLAGPETILTLLDELEAKDNRINRLEAIVAVAEHRNALMREWKRALKVPCDLVDDQVPVVIHGMVIRLERLKETEAKLEVAEKRIAELTESLKQTVSGYKTCLRTGYERILDLDGDCDTPEVMIAGSSEIQQAEKLLAAAAAKGE